MIYVLGDSISYPGYGASAWHGYVPVLQQLLNSQVSNLSAPGYMTADQTTNLCSISVVAGDTSIVELGTNDHWVYKDNVTQQGYFQGGLLAVVAYLATPQKLYGKNAAAADMTGAWSNTPSFGIGKMTDAIGSSIKFRVAGEAVYLGTIQFDGVYGEFTVTIDGVPHGSYQTNAPGLTTLNAMPCGQRVLRFAGLPSGEHEVVVSMTSGQYVFAEWCAGSAQDGLSPVYVCNITGMTPACYASRPPLSAATLQVYNDILGTVVTTLTLDGLPVSLVDNSSIFFPGSDTYSDGLHPNDTGHAKLAMNIRAAILN